MSLSNNRWHFSQQLVIHSHTELAGIKILLQVLDLAESEDNLALLVAADVDVITLEEVRVALIALLG